MAKKEVVPTTKSGIMAALAEAAGVTKKQAVAVYEKLVDIAIKGAKQEEKGIMLPGIGKVKLVKRPARTGRNPATGETIKIKAKKVAKIVACKETENGDRDKMRYSAVYPMDAERMLRRETKTTVAIYCGNQV